MLVCSAVGEHSYLVADHSVRCGTPHMIPGPIPGPASRHTRPCLTPYPALPHTIGSREHRNMLPLGLAIFILYTLLFPLVLAWKTRARFERVRRFQRRRIAEEAKRGIALDTSHFVWDSKDTNADPLSWLYSFLRPERYWWVSYILLRRVTVASVCIWVPS